MPGLNSTKCLENPNGACFYLAFLENTRPRAGIAQLVERNLAKVEVASSNLVSRSIFSCVAQSGSRRIEATKFWIIFS